MQDETDRQSEARAKKTIVYGSDAMNEGLVKLILGFMDCLVDRLVNHIPDFSSCGTIVPLVVV